MSAIENLSSRVARLPLDDIDTDQVIPARYLKTTERTGLGRHLFADWRYDLSGAPKPDFALNRPENAGAQILLAGRNFGCGSSREHAPWALSDFGFRAVVALSFADIFRQNALKNGLLPVAVSEAFHVAILALPQEEALTIDLVAATIRLPDGRSERFAVDPFAQRCLLKGVDQLGYLLSFSDQITAFEERRS